MNRILITGALAALAVACDGGSDAPPPSVRPEAPDPALEPAKEIERPDPERSCGCCQGMHTFLEKSCGDCRAVRITEEHALCNACAGRLRRCAHCGKALDR